MNLASLLSEIDLMINNSLCFSLGLSDSTNMHFNYPNTDFIAAAKLYQTISQNISHYKSQGGEEKIAQEKLQLIDEMVSMGVAYAKNKLDDASAIYLMTALNKDTKFDERTTYMAAVMACGLNPRTEKPEKAYSKLAYANFEEHFADIRRQNLAELKQTAPSFLHGPEYSIDLYTNLLTNIQ